MSKFFTLASSSAGNSYYIGASGCGLLIDCGISCKAVLGTLEENRIDIASIKGILLTHEHIDHIKGLKILLKKYNIPLYASPAVLRYISDNCLIPSGSTLHEINENGVLVGNMLVTGFKTSHDSVGSLGYSISTPDGHKISVCTDTGYLSDSARTHLLKSDLVLIESNYDEMMLKMGKYPYGLKKRISGSQGHLSNKDCSEFLPELVKSGTTYIILGHLSKENNFPELAEETCASELSMAGLCRNKDYILFAAPRSEPSEMVVL